MKLVDTLINLISKEKKNPKQHFARGSELALLSIDNDDFQPLSQIEGFLHSAQRIRAKGTWNSEDLTVLRRRLKGSSSSLMAKSMLQEADLGGVVFPNNSETISMKDLFSFCVSLTTVTLPDASDYVGSVDFNSVFRGCNKLNAVTNFNTYKRISDLSSAFSYCSVLSEITIFANPFPKGDMQTFEKVNRNIKITVPHGITIPSRWTQITPNNIIRKSVSSSE